MSSPDFFSAVNYDGQFLSHLRAINVNLRFQVTVNNDIIFQPTFFT